MKNLILNTVIVILLTLFSGCAFKSLSIDEMKKEIGNYELPQKASSGKAIVYIIRPSILGGFVKFNIFLDSKEDSAEIGYTKAKQYIYFDITPGKHIIYSKAENWALKEIDAKENDTIFIYQDPVMGVFYARNELFIVDNIEGTYLLKGLSLGTILNKDKEE